MGIERDRKKEGKREKEKESRKRKEQKKDGCRKQNTKHVRTNAKCNHPKYIR